MTNSTEDDATPSQGLARGAWERQGRNLPWNLQRNDSPAKPGAYHGSQRSPGEPNDKNRLTYQTCNQISLSLSHTRTPGLGTSINGILKGNRLGQHLQSSSLLMAWEDSRGYLGPCSLMATGLRSDWLSLSHCDHVGSNQQVEDLSLPISFCNS